MPLPNVIVASGVVPFLTTPSPLGHATVHCGGGMVVWAGQGRLVDGGGNHGFGRVWRGRWACSGHQAKLGRRAYRAAAKCTTRPLQALHAARVACASMLNSPAVHGSHVSGVLQCRGGRAVNVGKPPCAWPCQPRSAHGRVSRALHTAVQPRSARGRVKPPSARGHEHLWLCWQWCRMGLLAWQRLTKRAFLSAETVCRGFGCLQPCCSKPLKNCMLITG